ncbi:unnamed protein product, partial [Pocillopora meandrina]
MDANGSEAIFHMEGGSYTIDQHVLKVMIYTRYIRFLPVTWERSICLRVEVYHLYYLNSAEAQGMESGVISNSQMSASSQWSNLERAHYGRLHVKETQHNAGGRVARTNDENQWLQIDLNN